MQGSNAKKRELARLLHLATEAEKEGRLPDLTKYHEAILVLDPTRSASHYRLGRLAYTESRWAVAEAHQRQTIQYAPEWYAGYWQLGLALYQQRKLSESVTFLKEATRLEQKEAHIWANLAKVARDAGEIDVAEEAYKRALALAPGHTGITYSYAMHLLGDGQWSEGWRAFEDRFEGSDRAGRDRYPYDFPIWRGEQPPPGTTLIVVHEQGFGDAMMMMRFHPQLLSRFAHVIYELPRCLQRLGVVNLQGAEIAVPQSFVKGAGTGPVWQVCTMSLAFCLGATTPPLLGVPYITAAPQACEVWRQRLSVVGPGVRIGLLWHSGKITQLVGRDIDPSALAPLATIPGVRWFSLSNQPRPDTLGPWVIDSATLQTDFHETAALIHHLDIVISVDTAVAHLAAAMGKPLYLLSRFEGDWRWGNRRKACMWYDNARVYYQPTPGDWTSVINAVVADLQATD